MLGYPPDANTYEVESCKKTIKLNLPSTIGFFVYQNTKRRMLEFYYDCVDKYLDRSDFQLCEIDTDSAYMALSVVEYTPKPCFKRFGNAVSDERRAGDRDPSQAIIADTMKLVGNSSYGKAITNQERHRNVEYCSEIKASQLVNELYFRRLTPINNNTYEAESCEKTIKLNFPSAIGFFVYQNAKRRMLEFYYNCIDKNLDCSDFQLCGMDTDSAYMAHGSFRGKCGKPGET